MLHNQRDTIFVEILRTGERENCYHNLLDPSGKFGSNNLYGRMMVSEPESKTKVKSLQIAICGRVGSTPFVQKTAKLKKKYCLRLSCFQTSFKRSTASEWRQTGIRTNKMPITVDIHIPTIQLNLNISRIRVISRIRPIFKIRR